VVLSGVNDGVLGLLVELLVGENCECCGEGDGECEGDMTAAIVQPACAFGLCRVQT